MYAITGITGQVGRALAETLLAKGLPVRAVVRTADGAAQWRERGCEVAIVPNAADQDALARALAGTSGAFLMNPPNYDPEPGFPDAERVAAAYLHAVTHARPERVILLSTIGAQVARFNLLNNGGILERALGGAGVPLALLRPAWFMENARWDLAPACQGRIESFLQPVDRAIDMVAVRDIGETAAALMVEAWRGARVIELAGPDKVSPDRLAAAFAAALGRPVRAAAVPRETWEARFRADGMRHPEAHIQMLDGFNQGWIDFQREGCEQRRGRRTIESVVYDLVAVIGRSPCPSQSDLEPDAIIWRLENRGKTKR